MCEISYHWVESKVLKMKEDNSCRASLRFCWLLAFTALAVTQLQSVWPSHSFLLGVLQISNSPPLLRALIAHWYNVSWSPHLKILSHTYKTTLPKKITVTGSRASDLLSLSAYHNLGCTDLREELWGYLRKEVQKVHVSYDYQMFSPKKRFSILEEMS